MKLNENFQSLGESYLFVTIAKKVAAYQREHPEAKIIKMGIGDVTLPLAPAVIEALQARGIQTRPVWALIHEQADYPRNEAYRLDKAEDYRRHIVNLPCSTNLSLEDCERVCQAVLDL